MRLPLVDSSISLGIPVSTGLALGFLAECRFIMTYDHVPQANMTPDSTNTSNTAANAYILSRNTLLLCLSHMEYDEFGLKLVHRSYYTSQKSKIPSNGTSSKHHTCSFEQDPIKAVENIYKQNSMPQEPSQYNIFIKPSVLITCSRFLAISDESFTFNTS